MFGVLGLLAFLGGGVFSLIFVGTWVAERNADSELAFRYAQHIPALVLAALAGLMWAASAVSWYRGWWRLAALSTLFGCIIAVVAEYLNSLPPG
jgi:hypothetical protein